MSTGEQPQYRVYKRRLLYLLVAALINFSNGNTWITFASINFYTNDFYNYKNAALCMNAIFLVLAIFVGPLAMWLTDKYGLRLGFHIGIWTNLLGNILRFVASGPWMSPNWRFPIVMSGQTIAAFAQPFILVLPTKVAAIWFPEKQRDLATGASLLNPLGIAVMFSVAPLFVNESHPDNFAALTGACLAFAILCAALSFIITSSVPPTPVCEPPNVTPTWEGMKKCFRSRRFLIIAFCIGGGVGAFSALYSNLQPAMCSLGYSPIFNGIMGTVLILTGIVGTFIVCGINDKVQKTELVMKLCFACAGLAAASLTVAINYENQKTWIAISIAMFGFFAFPVYPLGLNAGVTVTTPIAEATSSGFIMIFGQIEGIIFLAITQLVIQDADPHTLGIQTCILNNENIQEVKNYKYSFIAWQAIVTSLILIFIVFFHIESRRRQHTRNSALINSSNSQESNVDAI